MHAAGFKPVDDRWRQMKAAYDACTAADVPVPERVSKFFNHDTPDEAGVEVEESDLKACGAITEWEADMREGYEIHVDRIPPDVKIVRVYMSY